jgi:hypothetical protein
LALDTQVAATSEVLAQSKPSEMTSPSDRNEPTRRLRRVIQMTAQYERLVCGRFAPAQQPQSTFICAISNASLTCTGLTGLEHESN